MDILKVILGFKKKESEGNITKKIKQLLEMLGGPIIRKTAQDEEPDIDERIDPIELNKERKRKLDKAPQWNEEFKNRIKPHLYDEKGLEKINFAGYIFTILQKKVGLLAAVNFLEDAYTFILSNLDVLLNSVLKGKRVNVEPLVKITMGRRDPNRAQLIPGYSFMGEVISKDVSSPFIYRVKFIGQGIEPETYRVDSSGSLLNLEVRAKYPMEISSTTASDIYIKVKHAERDRTYHPMVIVRQIYPMLEDGVSRFVNTEYERLISDAEKIEKEKDLVEKEISKLQIKLNEFIKNNDNESAEKVEQSIRIKRDRLNKLEEAGMKGIIDPEKQEEDYGERIQPEFETPETKKYRHDEPYKRWYNVHFSPGLEQKKVPYGGGGDMDEDFNDEDFEKVKMDLINSLEGDLPKRKGVPMKDIGRLLWEAITKVPDPLDRKGWKGVMLEKLKEYAEKNNIEDLKVKDWSLYNIINKEIVPEISKVLLHDEKFRRLRDNLTRALSRKLDRAVRATEIDEDKDHEYENIKKNIETLWHNPTMNREDLRKIYVNVAFEDMQPTDFMDYIENPTVFQFKKLLDRDLQKSLDVLKDINDDLGSISRIKHLAFIDRLKFLFLNKLWEMEEGLPEGSSEEGDYIEDAQTKQLQKTIDLFIDYKNEFPASQETSKVTTMRKMIREYIMKKWRKSPSDINIKVPREKQKREPSKKIKEPSQSEMVLRNQHKDLVNELDSIGF